MEVNSCKHKPGAIPCQFNHLKCPKGKDEYNLLITKEVYRVTQDALLILQTIPFKNAIIIFYL